MMHRTLHFIAAEYTHTCTLRYTSPAHCLPLRPLSPTVSTPDALFIPCFFSRLLIYIFASFFLQHTPTYPLPPNSTFLHVSPVVCKCGRILRANRVCQVFLSRVTWPILSVYFLGEHTLHFLIFPVGFFQHL